MIGPDLRKPSIATLAAAIIQTRGSAEPADILAAIQEADWALFSECHGNSADYKAWHAKATEQPQRDARATEELVAIIAHGGARDMSDEELEAIATPPAF